MKLYIGNKNYSSWSFRVWLTMRVKEIAFEEDLRPFDVENEYADFFEFSPSGKVPVLIDEGQTIWESMAILEYLAERHPDAGLWPLEASSRAHARAIAHEMHGGFTALRGACPMNMRRRVEPLPVDRQVRKDVCRIVAIWTECLHRYGGPYLFGASFCIADGMYAPIINRLQVYALSDAPAVQAYTRTLTQLPAWQDWESASRSEQWMVDIDEVYA